MLHLKKSGILVYHFDSDRNGGKVFTCSENTFHDMPFTTSSSSVMKEHLEEHAKDLSIEISFIRNWNKDV